MPSSQIEEKIQTSAPFFIIILVIIAIGCLVLSFSALRKQAKEKDVPEAAQTAQVKKPQLPAEKQTVHAPQPVPESTAPMHFYEPREGMRLYIYKGRPAFSGKNYFYYNVTVGHSEEPLFTNVYVPFAGFNEDGEAVTYLEVTPEQEEQLLLLEEEGAVIFVTPYRPA